MYRILVLSDIHSNLTALEAVLDAAGPVQEIWNLGDTIGYGPRPLECLAAVRGWRHNLAGNHDLACLNPAMLKDFNHVARTANTWNGNQLTDEARAWLGALQSTTRADSTIALAHGSPRDPVWEYLTNYLEAGPSFGHFAEQICFVGHSHLPRIFTQRRGATETLQGIPTDQTVLLFDAETRYIINPGSVGQPRDGDPRAAYAVFEPYEGRMAFHRVAYDIDHVQAEMLAAGLPEVLAERLAYGH